MRDLRKYASQTQNRMVIGLLLLVITLGLGLIWNFYGGNAALLGLLCIASTVVLILLILFILNIIGRISQ